MSKPKTSNLATKHIRTDGGTQTREEINESVVADYAEALKAGVKLPAAIVFHDGSNNWLADGFHRYWAANNIGKALLCEIRPGTRRDAVLHAAGANAEHGLRRSNETKRRAVMLLLNDEEWQQWSDRVIAEKCGVSHPFVASLRSTQVVTVTTSNDTRRGADGKQYPAQGSSTKPNEADSLDGESEETGDLIPSNSTELKVSNSTPLEPAPDADDEPDDGEPDFSLPPAEPGSNEEWDHPFGDVDAGDDEDEVLAPEVEPAPIYFEGETSGYFDDDDTPAAPSPIEFLVGDEVAGTTRKGEAILGIISDIFPADQDGRGVVFVKGDTNGACFTDRLSLATGRYLGDLMGLEPGHMVAWEWKGETVYGRYIEHSNDGRIAVADYFEPSKQYEPKTKELDVRRWTSEDRKRALELRDNRSAASDEHETPVAQPEPKLSVEEQIAALPLAQALALYKHGGHLFRQQASLWHQCQSVIKAARGKLSAIRYTTGPVTDAVNTVGKLPDPSEWEGCAACKGSHRVGERADPCARCVGGFTIHKGEGVSVDVVRASAESL